MTLDIATAIQILEANSGYDRNSGHWQAIRTLVEAAKTEVESIWMIAYVDRDIDNYRRSTLRDEHGFFLTEAAAEACISGLVYPFEYEAVELDKGWVGV